MTPDEFVRCFEEDTGYFVTVVSYMKWGRMLSLRYIDPNDHTLYSLRRDRAVNIIIDTKYSPYTEQNLASMLWQLSYIIP